MQDGKNLPEDEVKQTTQATSYRFGFRPASGYILQVWARQKNQ
jgi:hypothetical protein